MFWKPFRFEGKVYSLAHLDPKTVTYVQPAKGENPQREYTVDVTFSMHCFTRGLGDETPDPRLLFWDDRETRIFDFRRYALSFQLPAMIDALMKFKCFHTGNDNFFTVQIADEQGAEVDYEVYFTPSRSPKKGILNLFIQSAYVRDPAYRPARPKVAHWHQIGLGIILYNTLHKIPIKVPAK